jgi:hypothetical protein
MQTLGLAECPDFETVTLRHCPVLLSDQPQRCRICSQGCPGGAEFMTLGHMLRTT